MNEKIFSKHLRDDIAKVYNRAHIYLIQDSYRSGKKPYDFYVLNVGRFYSIECKYIKGQSILLDCVKPHQIDFLNEVRENFGRARIIIGMQNWNGGNHALVVNVKTWIMIKKIYYKRSSIKIDELVKFIDGMTNRNINGIIDRKKINGHLQWDVARLLT